MGLADLSGAAQITIGVFVGIISTSIQSVGLTLQRKSHLIEDDKPSHVTKRPPYRRRRWQIGILLFIVSNILGSTIQITTLPLVILSPLQASGLVFNSICATVILGEPFTRNSLFGTILVCVGAALIAAFGAMKEPAHSLDELLWLLGRRPFLLWMGAQALIIGAILIAAKASAVLSPRTKHTARMRMARGVAYGCVSGMISAHCLLLAKSAVELLVRTIVDGRNQFNRWQSWVILIGLVALALTQLYYLHRGLKLCSTSVLYPLVFCVYNIIAILDGLLYYRQASRLTALHGGLIALGTIILLCGVLCLSWRLQDDAVSKPLAQAQTALTPPFPGTPIEEESPAPSEEEPFLTSEASAHDKILSITRGTRRITEAEAIYGELEEDEDEWDFGYGTVGTGSTRSRWREERDGGDGETESLMTSGRRKRRKGNRGFPFPRMRSERLEARGQQDATGGWWRMRWWRRGDPDGNMSDEERR